jgi:hypothetical protein
MEAMLMQMKTLNLKKIHEEFLYLTLFHSQEFSAQIDKLPLSKAQKANFV